MTFCRNETNCIVYDSATQCPGHCGDNPICFGCADQSTRDLNLLRYDYVDLSQLIPRADQRSDTHIFRPAPESSPPINLAVWGLRAELAYQVLVTAHQARKHFTSGRQAPSAAPTREGWRLDHDIRWLGARIMDIAGLPAITHYWTNAELELSDRDGIAMLAAFGSLHRRARKLCGTDPRAITVPGECPTCSTPSLRRHDDNPEIIWCVHCKGKLDGDGYRRIVRLQIPGTT